MTALRYLSGVATLRLDATLCNGCGLCTQVCPHGVFVLEGRQARIKEFDLCMECGACARNCPAAALSVSAGVGCAEAIVRGWLTGTAPSCDCGGGESCC